jgi:hypothetical protein
MSFGARFLHQPERFPERPEGEPWGGRELALDLPGGPYRAAGLSAAQEEGVRATFPGCLLAAAPDLPRPASDPSARGVAVRLFRRAAGDFLPVDVRGWEYGLDFDCSPAAVRLAGLGLQARLDWSNWSEGGLAGALWTCEDGGPSFPGIFENFLRVLVAYRLLELGGVVLHSAGVVRHGAAFLFLGRSGAGKTTAARISLAQGAEVLSDDLNALSLCAGGCAVLKLPFTGDLGERRGVRPPVPLGALLRLEQADADAAAPLSRAETLACLLACSPFVNVDPFRRERLEKVLLALLAAGAPRALALRFSLRGGFWSILDRKA